MTGNAFKAERRQTPAMTAGPDDADSGTASGCGPEFDDRQVPTALPVRNDETQLRGIPSPCLKAGPQRHDFGGRFQGRSALQGLVRTVCVVPVSVAGEFRTSPALLYFNVLVRDPLAVYAPDPSAYPPSVWVNGDAASSVTYVADPVLCKNAIRRKSTTRIGRRDVSGGGVAVQRDSVAGVAV